jgi:flagellar M-ring protein FliF
MANSIAVSESVAALPAMRLNFFALPLQNRIGLMALAAASIALLVAGWLWSQAPDYKVLFTGIPDRDGGAVVAALAQMNVPYKMAENGGAILVPSNQVHEARLKLASQGLPKGGTPGFDLMDAPKFGITQFQEQVHYQRAIEGELAKSIQSIAAVRNARVHIAMPKQSMFLKDQQKATASVLLALYPGKWPASPIWCRAACPICRHATSA